MRTALLVVTLSLVFSLSPCSSENSVKNRWNSALRKKVHSFKVAAGKGGGPGGAEGIPSLNEAGAPLLTGLASRAAALRLAEINPPAALLIAQAGVLQGALEVTRIIAAGLQIPLAHLPSGTTRAGNDVDNASMLEALRSHTARVAALGPQQLSHLHLLAPTQGSGGSNGASGRKQSKSASSAAASASASGRKRKYKSRRRKWGDGGEVDDEDNVIEDEEEADDDEEDAIRGIGQQHTDMAELWGATMRQLDAAQAAAADSSSASTEVEAPFSSSSAAAAAAAMTTTTTSGRRRRGSIVVEAAPPVVTATAFTEAPSSAPAAPVGKHKQPSKKKQALLAAPVTASSDVTIGDPSASASGATEPPAAAATDPAVSGSIEADPAASASAPTNTTNTTTSGFSGIRGIRLTFGGAGGGGRGKRGGRGRGRGGGGGGAGRGLEPLDSRGKPLSRVIPGLEDDVLLCAADDATEDDRDGLLLHSDSGVEGGGEDADDVIDGLDRDVVLAAAAAAGSSARGHGAFVFSPLNGPLTAELRQVAPVASGAAAAAAAGERSFPASSPFSAFLSMSPRKMLSSSASSSSSATKAAALGVQRVSSSSEATVADVGGGDGAAAAAAEFLSRDTRASGSSDGPDDCLSMRMLMTGGGAGGSLGLPQLDFGASPMALAGLSDVSASRGVQGQGATSASAAMISAADFALSPSIDLTGYRPTGQLAAGSSHVSFSILTPTMMAAFDQKTAAHNNSGNSLPSFAFGSAASTASGSAASMLSSSATVGSAPFSSSSSGSGSGGGPWQPSRQAGVLARTRAMPPSSSPAAATPYVSDRPQVSYDVISSCDTPTDYHIGLGITPVALQQSQLMQQQSGGSGARLSLTSSTFEASAASFASPVGLKKGSRKKATSAAAKAAAALSASSAAKLRADGRPSRSHKPRANADYVYDHDVVHGPATSASSAAAGVDYGDSPFGSSSSGGSGGAAFIPPRLHVPPLHLNRLSHAFGPLGGGNCGSEQQTASASSSSAESAAAVAAPDSQQPQPQGEPKPTSPVALNASVGISLPRASAAASSGGGGVGAGSNQGNGVFGGYAPGTRGRGKATKASTSSAAGSRRSSQDPPEEHPHSRLFVSRNPALGLGPASAVGPRTAAGNNTATANVRTAAAVGASAAAATIGAPPQAAGFGGIPPHMGGSGGAGLEFSALLATATAGGGAFGLPQLLQQQAQLPSLVGNTSTTLSTALLTNQLIQNPSAATVAASLNIDLAGLLAQASVILSGAGFDFSALLAQTTRTIAQQQQQQQQAQQQAAQMHQQQMQMLRAAGGGGGIIPTAAFPSSMINSSSSSSVPSQPRPIINNNNTAAAAFERPVVDVSLGQPPAVPQQHSLPATAGHAALSLAMQPPQRPLFSPPSGVVRSSSASSSSSSSVNAQGAAIAALLISPDGRQQQQRPPSRSAGGASSKDGEAMAADIAEMSLSLEQLSFDGSTAAANNNKGGGGGDQRASK